MSDVKTNQQTRGRVGNRRRIVRLTAAGLGAALLAVLAQIALPIGPVPVTLQTLSVTLIAAALPVGTTLLAIVVYILMGLVGLPVFAGFRGGLSVLAGPTGGYIWGFILQGLIIGGLIACFEYLAAGRDDKPQVRRLGLLITGIVGGLIGLTVLYLTGTLQLSAVLGLTFKEGLALGVIPFILKDVLSVVLGIFIGLAVRRALGRSRLG